MSRKDDDRMKKYELTNEIKNLANGVVLYRIRALKDFAGVKAGDLGGFVQSEANLDQNGGAWIYENARAYEDAVVFGDAEVYGNAEVYGCAWVCDRVRVFGNAKICSKAEVCGYANVSGDALVYSDDDFAVIKGFGRAHRSTTFFRCQDGKVRVQCGCFYGNLDEFRAKVKETHGDSKMAREYLMIADLMELHFKKE